MPCKIYLRDLIIQEAQNQGVPPAIVLAIAVQETGIRHWNAKGDVITNANPNGTTDVGVMQLNSNTWPGLGVDPYDVNDNIRGGVKLLRQLYARYGDWPTAVMRYNGSGQKAQQYSRSVMARASVLGATLEVASQCAEAGDAANVSIAGAMLPSVPNLPNVDTKTLLVAGGALAGAGLLLWMFA